MLHGCHRQRRSDTERFWSRCNTRENHPIADTWEGPTSRSGRQHCGRPMMYLIKKTAPPEKKKGWKRTWKSPQMIKMSMPSQPLFWQAKATESYIGFSWPCPCKTSAPEPEHGLSRIGVCVSSRNPRPLPEHRPFLISRYQPCLGRVLLITGSLGPFREVFQA